MLHACFVHAFGCFCTGVCMRLYAWFVLVLFVPVLDFDMLHACFVHAFGMPVLCCLLVLYLRLAVSCAATVVAAPAAC